jgi:hypothetical protein
MHKDGITVAEYWAELPPKAELEQQLHQALQEARERLARRGAHACCGGRKIEWVGFERLPDATLFGVEHIPVSTQQATSNKSCSQETRGSNLHGKT